MAVPLEDNMLSSPLSDESMLDETSEVPLPFIRFKLDGKRNSTSLASLPPQMEHVPIEYWTVFWSKIDTIIQTKVKRLDTIFLAINLTLICGWIWTIALLDFDEPATSTVICILSLAPFLAGPCVEYWRDVYLEQIRSYCRDEEKCVFWSYGFALEVDYEIYNVGRGNALYLYFLPLSNNNVGANARSENGKMHLHNGYLRVEIMEDLPLVLAVCCGPKLTSMPSLPSYDYLPSGMEKLSLDEWREFLSKMDTISNAYISCMHTQHVAIQVVIGLLMFQVVSIVFEWGVVMIVALVLSFISLIFLGSSINRLKTLVSDRNSCVEEYTGKFARQGVFLEYRKHGKFNWLVGRHMCHYVYLFPPTETA
jgi:hypothetical protein